MSRVKQAAVRRFILLLGFSVFLMTLQISLRSQDGPPGVHSIVLTDSTRRVVFDSRAFNGPSTPVPQWDNGYLVSREIETFQAGVPNVRLYNTSGEKTREAVIWFPGSQRVLIYSATATPDGRIIAAGTAEKADGTAAPFIALTDTAGKMTKVIQTKGFFPVNICQAPDGTVWSFGGTGYDEHSQPTPGDTLRHFDLQKGEISSYLPRSTFLKRPGPEIKAYIRCSTDGVVAYSPNALEYIEMSYGGNSPRVYHAKAPSGLRLGGFAVTGSKKVYGYLFNAGNGGLYYLLFDEAGSTVQWQPVEGAVGVHTKSGVIVGLWGSDGDKLLVSQGQDSAGYAAIYWATPLDK